MAEITYGSDPLDDSSRILEVEDNEPEPTDDDEISDEDEIDDSDNGDPIMYDSDNGDPIWHPNDEDEIDDSDIISDPTLPECSSTSGTPCTDSESTLTWSAKSADQMNWENAGSYCENLTEGGYTDWRLPTIDELRTLIQECAATEPGGSCGVTESCLSSSCRDDSCNSCSNDSTGGHSKFGETSSLWSSSTLSDYTDTAWFVNFKNGIVYNNLKSSNYYVRCVR